MSLPQSRAAYPTAYHQLAWMCLALSLLPTQSSRDAPGPAPSSLTPICHCSQAWLLTAAQQPAGRLTDASFRQDPVWF